MEISLLQQFNFNKYTMNITLILFRTVTLRFALYRKNIISYTRRFLILEGYYSVDSKGPAFMLLSEGLFILNLALFLSRSMVSNFFGRKVGVSGAHSITCFSVIVTTLLAVMAFCGVVLNNTSNIEVLFKGIINIRFYCRNESFKFHNFVAKRHIVNYLLKNKVYFSTSSLNSEDSNNLKPAAAYINADVDKEEAHFSTELNKKEEQKLRARERMLQLNEAKGVRVEVTDLRTNEITTYNSLRLAAKALNTDLKALYYNEKISKERGKLIPFKNHYYLNIVRGVTDSRDVLNILGVTDTVYTEKFVLSQDFIEWFRGFVDAEGCFYLNKDQGSNYKFRFKIVLHIDDKGVLDFIQNTLKIGKVSTMKSKATLTVSAKKEISLIIYIFSSLCSLNTTKHLDFLAFKEAFELYWSISPQSTEIPAATCKVSHDELANAAITPTTKDQISLKIDIIKNSMNSKRSIHEMPKDHEIRITPYWLLGFVEGDGSFFVSNTGALIFTIKQKGNLAVMKAIQNFFNKLLICNTPLIASNSILIEKGLQASRDSSSTATLNMNESGSFLNNQLNVAYLVTSQQKEIEVNSLTIGQESIIKMVLIPLLDSLIWRSKKEKDYIDWKTILKIKNLGLNYGKGSEIIKLIAGQMNNNRLSTAGLEPINRTWLMSEIDKLLNGDTPICKQSQEVSGIENSPEIEVNIEESSSKRLWSNKAVIVHLVEVSDESQEFTPSSLINTIGTFKSLAKCAEYLGISTSGLQHRLRKDKPFLFKGKLVKIIRM